MKVGVVGAGTMGAGIAQVCLTAGHDVALHDVDAAALARGRARVEAGLDRLVAGNRLGLGERSAALARLTEAATLDACAAAADVVVEAAVEALEPKRSIFGALDRSAPPEALLASNTSAHSIDVLAGATGRPERVLGLHFFNPAPVMSLVEVVAGERTSRGTIVSARAFVEGLGKTPVSCADSPGFIVNRVNRPFSLEPLRMLEAGEAGIEALDAAIAGAGYPLGPFAYLDLVGIDVNLAATTAIWRGFDEDERFRPVAIQERLMAAGALGRKAGHGFYVYDAAGKEERPADAFAAGASASVLAPEAIVERVELAIINEAYQTAGDGVAGAADIDLALRLGARHPSGPFERAGQLGLRAVVQGLARLEAAYGERYRVAPALWQIASV